MISVWIRMSLGGAPLPFASFSMAMMVSLRMQPTSHSSSLPMMSLLAFTWASKPTTQTPVLTEKRKSSFLSYLKWVSRAISALKLAFTKSGNRAWAYLKPLRRVSAGLNGQATQSTTGQTMPGALTFFRRMTLLRDAVGHMLQLSGLAMPVFT